MESLSTSCKCKALTVKIENTFDFASFVDKVSKKNPTHALMQAKAIPLLLSKGKFAQALRCAKALHEHNKDHPLAMRALLTFFKFFFADEKLKLFAGEMAKLGCPADVAGLTNKWVNDYAVNKDFAALETELEKVRALSKNCGDTNSADWELRVCTALAATPTRLLNVKTVIAANKFLQKHKSGARFQKAPIEKFPSAKKLSA